MKTTPLFSSSIVYLGIGLIIIFFTGMETSCSSGKKEPYRTERKTGGSKTMFAIESDAFKNGETIPERYTCDGEDVSPLLKWSNPPLGTKSYALICHDPDAPVGDWVHWVIYSIPGTLTELKVNIPKLKEIPGTGIQGINDFGRYGYGGPCPPKPSKHRYYFVLYALDKNLKLEPGLSRKQLEKKIKGHVLSKTTLMGKYKRK